MKKALLVTELITGIIFSNNTLAGIAGDAGVADACGTGCSYTISTDGKTLIITGTGDNASIAKSAFTPNYDGSGNWLPGNERDTRFNSIRNVVITGTIKTISSFAFIGNNFSSVVIPEGVISIGNHAFQSTNLTSITIPESVTSIGWGAFSKNNLTSVIIPDNVTTLSQVAFQGNPNLSSVIIGDGVTSIATDVFSDISNDAKIYCRNTSEDRCFNLINKNNSSDLSKLVLFNKQGDRYVLNGIKYKTLNDMQNGVPVKRIYTIDEANALSKPTGNTIKLRYR